MFLGLGLLRNLKIVVPQAGLLALVAFFIAFGASAPFLGGSNVAIFSALLGRNSTLTGRTDVWAAVLPTMKRQPLLGYGFGSFWTDARRILYDIPTAHNGYLDILLELGAVGLAFYTVWLLSCARKLHRALARDYQWASLAICFLLMSLIYNTTESSLNSLAEQLTAVLVLASTVVSRKPITANNRKKSRTAPAPNAEVSLGAVAARWQALSRQWIPKPRNANKVELHGRTGGLYKRKVQSNEAFGPPAAVYQRVLSCQPFGCYLADMTIPPKSLTPQCICTMFLICVCLALPGIASAGTYWVSPTGAAAWANCRGATPLSGASACSLHSKQQCGSRRYGLPAGRNVLRRNHPPLK